MRVKALAVTILASFVAVGSAMAQEEQRGWHGKIVPYLWTTGIEGDATVGGRDVDVDVGFDDILDKTDAGGSLIVVLNHDRLVFMGEVDYLDMSTDIKTPAGAEGNLDSTTTIGTLAVGWRFRGQTADRTLDLLFGGRQLSLDNELSLDGIGTFEGDEEFTDAILIAIPRFPFAERWSFNPILSYGRGDSDSTWEFWPQFRYSTGEHWDAHAGYRRLHYDLEGERGNRFDAVFHGLTVGLGYVF